MATDLLFQMATYLLFKWAQIFGYRSFVQMSMYLFFCSNEHVSFLYDENVVLAHFFQKGHMHMAMCTWYMWFEHVHVKEGPRDAEKNGLGF